MKLIPLASPHYNSGQSGAERLQAPPPAPQVQSDGTSRFSRTEDIAGASPYDRVNTAEFRIEFSHTEPTGRASKELLAQLERGRAISRMNFKA